MRALGDFIAGKFCVAEGEPLRSVNPARGGEVVLETASTPGRMTLACQAAAEAQVGWGRLSLAERAEHLSRFRAAITERAGPLADAVVLETGKLRSEARAEVGSLISRFDLVHTVVARDLEGGPVPGRPAEILRYHPLGVVGVIGPFNFPLHLCHAHVVPALLAGNAVVVKPSDVTPLCGQRYAEAAQAAGLPAGVFNLVQGGASAGAALARAPEVRGLCFTGSYRVGRLLSEALLDRPEVLLALEMGGKNTAVVLEDADLYQAAHEIALGGYLTSGQRCTATERVLVTRSRIKQLADALRKLVGALRFGDPEDGASFAGPMSTREGRSRFADALAQAHAAGAEQLVGGGRERGPSDDFFAPASLHILPEGTRDIAGYTDQELFGPDLALQAVEDDDEAIAVLRANPYGLANSVFTGDDARFERFYQETYSGILNRNRSTNLASPMLPFGGVGRSGNYRPAGAYAPRNTVYPVAVQENVIGWGQFHPQLASLMPDPDLDRLDAQHSAEEQAEAARNLLDSPRPRDIQLPAGGQLPTSQAWLRRLYAGDRVVAEKKPPVFDHLRSSGPWLVSVDDEPLSVLDGMSQTSTLVAGFAEPTVVQAFVEGHFGDSLVQNRDTAVDPGPEAEALATELRQLVPGLDHVTFCNSGAEANEKALALCQLNGPEGATRVLAFEGGFHGRTLWALHATWNPAKRTPFELAGYEANFVPFPTWAHPSGEQPAAPSGYYAAAGSADIETLRTRFGDADDDALLAEEVASLIAVDAELRTGQVFAVIIEPMQAEGGDRYATMRFFRALRLLTRYHGVSLIMDEVQTGFGLGGRFAWHEDFRLVNFRGRPDYPDAVTFAKRAQLGVCMSRFEDPEPTSAHVASMIRGRLHAEMLTTEHSADRIEKLVSRRLERLAQGFPHLVTSPRCKGFAFSFDLPSAEHLSAYLGQRFWRGVVVFGAGERTVRYRLSESYLVREVDMLFDRVRRSLSWLDAHPGKSPPLWEDAGPGEREPAETPEYRLRVVTAEEADTYLPIILEIEERVYEPARRTPPEDIREALCDPEGVVVVCEVPDGDGWRFVGFAIGYPLERAAEVEEGPDRDPMLGKHNTLYSVSLTLAVEFHGSGIGRLLKLEQLREAARRKTADGRPRYRYVTGRNRIGHTPRMTHLNWVFGAHLVAILTGQYEDPEGQAIYYRIPLAPIAPEREAAAEGITGEPPMVQDDGLDVSQGICRPFDRAPETLYRAEAEGLLYGPAVNKITLMNYVTPAVVRALEWVSALYPRLPHLYLTSSRDETVDKCMRLLRCHRADAQIAIGFAGGYLGHTTGAARSLSDPAIHRQGPAPFGFPRVPHPADAGSEATIAALRAAIEEAGGPERVLGVFFELVQERTGKVVPREFWPLAAQLRTETGVPLVAVETATACYRSGHGAFASSGQAVAPDILCWWGGAQTGYLHVAGRWRVAKPLTLVSTWDGDELSLIREHHQLRAARRIDVTGAGAELTRVLEPAQAAGFPVRGLGLYRVIEAGDRADALARALAYHGVRVRCFPGGYLGIAPALDATSRVVATMQDALPRALEAVK